MGEPGDGIGLAAAGGMLDEIAPPNAVNLGLGEELADNIELVITREDLNRFLGFGLFIFGGDDLGEIFDDSGEALTGEDSFPEIIGFEAVRVRRVAGAVVPTLVKGQKPGGFTLEVSTHAHFVIIDGEMNDTAPELEELFARVTVAFVLFDGIGDGLLGEAVFELKGGNRQAVDEETQVESELGFIAAVAQLAGDGKAVGGETLDGFGVAGGGGAVKEIDLVRPVHEAVAQDMDDAMLADFTLKTGEEFMADRGLFEETEGFDQFGLGGLDEERELGEIDGVFAVVIGGVAGQPTAAAITG